MLHELLHVYYRNERPWAVPYPKSDGARGGDVRSSCSGTDSCGVDPQNAYRLTDVQKFTFRMDTLRSKHTSPDRPYEATDALVAQYVSEGAVYMYRLWL